MADRYDFDGNLREHIQLAETLLTQIFTEDRSKLIERLRAGFAFGHADPTAENKIELFDKLSLLSEGTFEALMGGGQSFKPMMVTYLWEHLVRARLFVRQMRAEPGLMADHQVDQRKLFQHLRDGTFPNIFLPTSALHERYSAAVVAVDVVLASGNESRGSGFITRDEHERRWLITCRHNVDPDAGISVQKMTTGAGVEITVGPAWLSPDFDIAVFPLVTDLNSHSLVLLNEAIVFEEVYTLGFPQVPGALPILLGHRGEVNGRASMYMQRCEVLIISNLVSPGSSGCPVLNRDGRCIGMTIQWIEGEWEDQKARFSAALPSDLLASALVDASRQLK